MISKLEWYVTKHIPRISVCLALAASGCADLDGEDEPTLEETTSEISMAGGATWGTPGNAGALLELGFTSQETCFLSGVAGSFVGNPWLWYEKGASYKPAVAEVFPSGGKWWVKTRAGTGPGVLARVVCVNIPYSQTHELSWSNNITSSGIAAPAGRHCFLRKVWATSGLSGDTVGSTVTNLTIKKRNGYFDMNDSYVENSGGDTEFGGATAVCIDFPATGEWNYTFIGPTNATNSASMTTYLRDYYPDGPLVPITNVLCALTGISGKWVSGSPDPLGWNNGVLLNNDPSSTSYWKVTATNGRVGNVQCIK